MKLLESHLATPENIAPYLIDIVKYFEKQGVNCSPYPRVKILRDPGNASNPLGITGYYDPATKTIALYILNRHMKDVLRSFAHELIHHDQCLNYGDEVYIDTQNVNDSKYLQKLEADAYFRGNMLFRSWENNLKETR
jgi:hypothetical protein